MLVTAAALFGLAALGGVVMAFQHFRQDRNPPWSLAIAHGALAATALVLLVWAVVQSGAGPYVGWALGLFVVAALGGFFLVSFPLRGRRLPSPVLVVHALVAVVAFALLLTGILAATPA